jgi:hypothetical protein
MRLWVKLLALSWVRVASEDWNNHLIIYEKTLSNQIYMVSITSVLSRLHSLIKLTKLWDHIITKELKFYINKEGKEIFYKP